MVEWTGWCPAVSAAAIKPRVISSQSCSSGMNTDGRKMAKDLGEKFVRWRKALIANTPSTVKLRLCLQCVGGRATEDNCYGWEDCYAL